MSYTFSTVFLSLLLKTLPQPNAQNLQTGYYQEVNGQMPAEGAWEKYCMYLKYILGQFSPIASISGNGSLFISNERSFTKYTAYERL